jgi:hypothetical protein
MATAIQSGRERHIAEDGWGLMASDSSRGAPDDLITCIIKIPNSRPAIAGHKPKTDFGFNIEV